MGDADIRLEKAALRTRARNARRAIPPGARAEAARLLAEHVLALPELDGARTVLLYGAAPEEIDPVVIENELRARGVRIGYPRVAGKAALTLHLVTGPKSLVKGAFGLREPTASAPLLMPEEVDLAIVPGVAFDAAGGRLGYGGGYYDALLAGGLSHALLVGVAFDEQVVARVPREAQDRAVDVLVTPTRTIRPQRA